MQLNRRTVFFLLLLGRVGTLVAIPGNNESDLNLDCTNDYEDLMSCQLNGQNCSEYNLTLKNNDWYGETLCSLKECGTKLCCCSVKMMLIPGETHTATVSKGGESLESKIISILDTIKPRTPTIVAVNKSNGNIEVFWKTNTNSRIDLTAEVTYYRKGDTEKVSERVSPAFQRGYMYYGINGQNLIPNTTYVVSVRSYTNRSGKFSDSSEEWEFTTDPADSTVAIFIAVVILLSFVAAILTGALYACSLKLKTKIWDPAAKYPNPKLLDIPPVKPQLWRPERTIISPICVEPLILHDSKPWSKMSLTDTSSGSFQQSSGISMSSSCLSYANAEPVDVGAKVQDALCKAFPNISPVSLLATSPLAELNRGSDLLSAPYNPCSSGSSGIDNKTYSIVIPICPTEILADSSEVKKQADMSCDPAYHSSESNAVNCPDQQVLLPLLSPSMASPVLTDMSYQQCNADSGRFSDAEESSLSSISSGTNTATSCDVVSRAEAGCESSAEVVSDVTRLNGNSEKASIDVRNPSQGCVPAPRLLTVEDDYQAFQNLVQQPDVSLTEQKSDGNHFDNYKEESPSKIPQFILSPVVPGFMNGAQGLSELQSHLFFMSKGAAERPLPVITDSGYQSV